MGQEKQVESWFNEVAMEQTEDWLTENVQFAISGYVLYGKAIIKTPLQSGDWIAAGIQTDLTTSNIRTAVLRANNIYIQGEELLGFDYVTYYQESNVNLNQTDQMQVGNYTEDFEV